MAILCTLKNINLAFGTKVLFKNTGLIIRRRDRIGLLGLNGAGKTSLFRILTETVFPDISTPPFQFDKAKRSQNPDDDFSCFLVPQEVPVSPNDTMSVKDFIYCFYPELKNVNSDLKEINNTLALDLTNDKRNELIEKQKNILGLFEHHDGWSLCNAYESYLKYFGLKDLDAKMIDLSGGEQKKVLLALGLSSRTNIILWDEPTNHLDLETIKMFENEIGQSSNKAHIIISHDRYLLSRTTDRILHIDQGEIKNFNGGYTEYLEFLSQEEENRIKLLDKLKNSLRRETEWMRQGIKARGCRSKKRVEGFHGLSKSVADIKDKELQSLKIKIHDSQRKTKKLVELKSVSFSYSSDAPALFTDLNLSISKGDKIGLLGANGVGKTTLLNLVSGILDPICGSVYKADQLKVKYFSQKRDELNLDATPYELLGGGTDFVTLANGGQRHVTSYFESFLFNRDDINRPIKDFSGGEKNRLQMALNLRQEGDLWIFDEPTNDLDLETLQILEKHLTDFRGSVILISHDRAFLSAITNKIWLLNSKSIENFNGGYSQVESYIDALTLEEIINSDTDYDVKETQEPHKLSSLESNEKTVTKPRLSNKEKERLKVIDDEIFETENKLELAEEIVNNFDFSNMDQKKSDLFHEATAQKDSLEEKLENLYDELYTLKQKV